MLNIVLNTLTLLIFAAEKPVEEVPKMEAPKFIVPVKDIETPVGKTVTFTCKATGVPTPEFKWFKNDKEIIPVDQQITIEVKDNGETSLVITNVQPEHDGTYSCQATNPAGSDKTKAELFVEGVLDVCKVEYGCSVDISRLQPTVCLILVPAILSLWIHTIVYDPVLFSILI